MSSRNGYRLFSRSRSRSPVRFRSRSRSRSRDRQNHYHQDYHYRRDRHHSHYRPHHHLHAPYDPHRERNYQRPHPLYRSYDDRKTPSPEPIRNKSPSPKLTSRIVFPQASVHVPRPQTPVHAPRPHAPVVTLLCSGCGSQIAARSFSKNQKKKKTNRRCTDCVDNNIKAGMFIINDQNEIERVRSPSPSPPQPSATLQSNVNDVNISSMPLTTNTNLNLNVNNLNNTNNNKNNIFSCNWCDSTYSSITQLTVHCNQTHFNDDQKQDTNMTWKCNSCQFVNKNKLIAICEICEVPYNQDDNENNKENDNKKKQMEKIVPIDGRWIVFYSDFSDEDNKENDYNKLFKHRYKMDVKIISSTNKIKTVYGKCVENSGGYEWPFRLKGTLDNNNLFIFTMNSKSTCTNSVIYCKARFDGRNLLKRGIWCLDQDLKETSGILNAERDTDYEILNADADKKEKEVLCVICMDNKCNVASVPCGHVSTCRKCVDEVKKSGKCPFCAMPITSTMNVFISGF